jgi:WD40 repeat protein
MTQTAAPRLAGSVHHMCFLSVDSELVLVAARNQGIELIDSDNGTPLRVIARRRIATAVAAVPGPGDRGDILLAGDPEGFLYGYDPVTGSEVINQRLGVGSIKDLEVYATTDGPAVAAVLESGLYLWRPGTQTATRLPDPPGREPGRLFKVCAYTSGDRQYLTCAYTDGYFATWDLAETDADPTMQLAHDGPIWSLLSTEDGDGQSIVVSGSSDRRMRVWSPDDDRDAGSGTGLLPRESFVADGTIRRLGQVSDKQMTMLITASATGSVSLWRLDGSPDRPELEISHHGSEAWALACATTVDGVLIASGDMNGDIQIKRLSTALLTEGSVRELFQTETTIWAVTHGDTVDGAYIACAGVDQTVNIIDPTGRRGVLALRRHSSTVRSLAAGGDRERPHLISGGADQKVLDWDPRNGQLRAELPMGHQGEVWALATFRDSDGEYVISGSADGSVRMIALDSRTSVVRVLATDCGEVNTVIVVPTEDDAIVVVGSGKGLRALSLRHQTDDPLILPAVNVACGVHDADRRLVIAALHDGRVQLIDPIAGATVSTFAVSHGSGHVRALKAVEVGGTTFVLGGCDDGRILVWHIDGTLVSNPVRKGAASIRSMDIIEIARPPDAVRPTTSPTQSALISAGQDGTVRLWPVTIDSPLRSGGSVGRGVRPASILLQDQPTDRDNLARNPLVETLYDALRSPNTQPPVVVGVHAPWGQGKSSLLRQLRSRVDPWTDRFEANAHPAAEQQPTHRLVAKSDRPAGWRWWRRGAQPQVRTRLTRAWAWGQIQRSGDRDAPLTYEMGPRVAGTYDAITVWFNPWMYERTDQIWAGLTREILIAVTERLSKPERERLWFDLNLRRTDPTVLRRRIIATYIPRTLGGLLVGALLLLMAVVAGVSMGVTAVHEPKVVALLGPTTLIMLTILGAIAQLTSGSFRHIHGWVAPDELNNTAGPEHAWRGTADPLTSTDRGYLYMLQHDVGEVVGLATQHGPLYVFIDDLDRCGSAIVADTVEAINLFLNKAFGQCIFVIALDPATVAAHLETAFKDLNERAAADPASFGHLRHTGWRFMEKIIDLPIRLPRVPDTALSSYLDRLLDTAPVVPSPVQVTTPRPSRRAWAPRQRAKADHPDPPAKPDPTVGTTIRATTTLKLVIVPETPTTSSSVAAIGELEALPPVRDALRAAVLSLPGRNPRQTKAFINLWRFYMVLDHRMGLFSPSLLAIERHSIEMARLVELMVRWPYLLDPLGERFSEGATGPRSSLDRLLDICAADDEPWAAGAHQARLDPSDRDVQGLRELLRHALPHREVFSSIAHRYL